MKQLPLLSQDIFTVISDAENLPLDERVDFINSVREALHNISPFKSEPVDFVRWVKNTQVYANDYNPNSVAPPEMELLRISIDSDGYTQPIVSMPDSDGYEVIDGFHRHRVGKEYQDIQKRVHGYLPLVEIKSDRRDKSDRMAATIRHNRARGKHKVESMSDIVIELKKRNWSDERVAKELGMEADEVLRLCQLSGLTELFSDQEFSMSWDIDDNIDEFNALDEEQVEAKDTSGRVLHTWDKWECYLAGFYENKPINRDLSDDDCRNAYAEFLRDTPKFEGALNRVIDEWKNSCEHYLTNENMNRIAWLGQASLCISEGIPSIFCGGFYYLSDDEQNKANETALKYLNIWRGRRCELPLSMEEAAPRTKANLY
jgi:ParB-like chromosome segregation protein Spo0J